MPGYYPININIEKARCMVVGGGNVAERKTATLLSYRADVTVVSPCCTPKLNLMAEKGEIRLLNRRYQKGDCLGMRLVIVATDSDETNRKAAEDAMAANCLVNVVDQPHISNFIVPATHRQGDLQISVSTNGKSPALARRIRERLEAEFGPEYSRFLELIGEIRQKALNRISDPKKRSRLFYDLVDSDIIQLIREGKTQEIEKRLEGLLEHSML
ncbi:bifunctional precorrin-2 dehydrogenase/sirohydrochlorin ferrochelatase [bacterium]|nr:bifunctional precorrin-2 dehydrogenase/sirohydrochlorin ferrochelatase [bacterium]